MHDGYSWCLPVFIYCVGSGRDCETQQLLKKRHCHTYKTRPKVCEIHGFWRTIRQRYHLINQLTHVLGSCMWLLDWFIVWRRRCHSSSVILYWIKQTRVRAWSKLDQTTVGLFSLICWAYLRLLSRSIFPSRRELFTAIHSDQGKA